MFAELRLNLLKFSHPTVLETSLFKDLVRHYEQFYKLQPLTARIYALLILNNCSKGLSFDNLVATLQVSKSSVSHSVNALLDLNFIEQLKQDNERKRYFRIHKNFFLMRLEDVNIRLIREKEINEKLKEYRKEDGNTMFHKDEFDYYLSHLHDVTSSVEKTIENLKLHIKPNEE